MDQAGQGQQMTGPGYSAKKQVRPGQQSLSLKQAPPACTQELRALEGFFDGAKEGALEGENLGTFFIFLVFFPFIPSLIRSFVSSLE